MFGLAGLVVVTVELLRSRFFVAGAAIVGAPFFGLVFGESWMARQMNEALCTVQPVPASVPLARRGHVISRQLALYTPVATLLAFVAIHGDAPFLAAILLGVPLACARQYRGFRAWECEHGVELLTKPTLASHRGLYTTVTTNDQEPTRPDSRL